jgi:hypothetical protein
VNKGKSIHKFCLSLFIIQRNALCISYTFLCQFSLTFHRINILENGNNTKFILTPFQHKGSTKPPFIYTAGARHYSTTKIPKTDKTQTAANTESFLQSGTRNIGKTDNPYNLTITSGKRNHILPVGVFCTASRINQHTPPPRSSDRCILWCLLFFLPNSIGWWFAIRPGVLRA